MPQAIIQSKKALLIAEHMHLISSELLTLTQDIDNAIGDVAECRIEEEELIDKLNTTLNSLTLLTDKALKV